jgi:hypothetical protein
VESLTFNPLEETPQPARAGRGDSKSTREFLLMFKEDVMRDRVDGIIRDFPGTVVEKHTFYLAFGEHYIYRLQVPEGETVEQWIAFYRNRPETKYAQPYHPGEKVQPPPG